MNLIDANPFHKIKKMPWVFLMLLAACANIADVSTTEPAPVATAPLTASVEIVDEDQILRIFNADSPTTLNPYFSLGDQDFGPARIVYEPLADFDRDGNLIPVLAEEIPSLENGGLTDDNRVVTWKLRRDVLWSDGKPFTAKDVLFTYSFIMNPDTGVVSTSEYEQIVGVEALDNYTVRIEFENGNPAWYMSFSGIRGVILPEHAFKAFPGQTARNAPANKIPVGTGPYVVREPGIKPQAVLLFSSQMVKTTKIVFEPNPHYRFPNKPAFKEIIWLGGGDLKEANRRLFEVGDLHVVHLPDDAYASGAGGKGEILLVPISGVVRLLLNFTDPHSASDQGEYSSLEVPHPFLSDKRVRQAIAHAIDRQAIFERAFKYGSPAYAVLVSPSQYFSGKVFYEYDPERAKALLDEAGYIDSDGDGFREKDGSRVKLVFQTFINPDVEETQKVVKDNLNAIGIDVVLKTTDSAAMFGADTSNPDNAARFNADLMMFQTSSDSLDPAAFMNTWSCDQIPQMENNWTAGNNNERWCNAVYDDLLQRSKTEIDPAKRGELFIEMNDIFVKEVASVPLAWNRKLLGVSKQLAGLDPAPWNPLTWNIQDWHFIQP